MTDTKHMPTWLEAAADQRAADIVRRIDVKATIESNSVIMSFLREPPDDDQVTIDLWEHACDNCQEVDAPGYEVHMIKRLIRTKEGDVPMALTAGACGRCWEAP